MFILKTPELAPRCPHYSSPEAQPVSVTQPGGPIMAPFLSSFPSRSLLGHSPPSFREATVPSQAIKGSHLMSSPSAAHAHPHPHGPQLFPAPQRSCLPFLSFRAWQRPHLLLKSSQLFLARIRSVLKCLQRTLISLQHFRSKHRRTGGEVGGYRKRDGQLLQRGETTTS